MEPERCLEDAANVAPQPEGCEMMEILVCALIRKAIMPLSEIHTF